MTAPSPSDLPRHHHRPPQEGEEDVLRVAAGSDVQAVASAIAYALYEKPRVKVRAVGAGAVSQATKAIAIARGYVAPMGLDLYARPGFEQTTGRDDTTINAIIWRLDVS